MEPDRIDQRRVGGHVPVLIEPNIAQLVRADLAKVDRRSTPVDSVPSVVHQNQHILRVRFEWDDATSRTAIIADNPERIVESKRCVGGVCTDNYAPALTVCKGERVGTARVERGDGENARVPDVQIRDADAPSSGVANLDRVECKRHLQTVNVERVELHAGLRVVEFGSPEYGDRNIKAGSATIVAPDLNRRFNVSSNRCLKSCGNGPR